MSPYLLVSRGYTVQPVQPRIQGPRDPLELRLTIRTFILVTKATTDAIDIIFTANYTVQSSSLTSIITNGVQVWDPKIFSQCCVKVLGMLKLTGIQSDGQRHSWPRSRGLHQHLDQNSRRTQGLLSVSISSLSFFWRSVLKFSNFKRLWQMWIFPWTNFWN